MICFAHGALIWRRTSGCIRAVSSNGCSVLLFSIRERRLLLVPFL